MKKNNPCSTPLLHSACTMNNTSVNYFLSASSVVRGAPSLRTSGTILTPQTLLLSPECRGCPAVLVCMQEGWPYNNLGACVGCGSVGLTRNNPFDPHTQWTLPGGSASRIIRCTPLYDAHLQTRLAAPTHGITRMRETLCPFCAFLKDIRHRGWSQPTEARVLAHLRKEAGAHYYEGNLVCGTGCMLSYISYVNTLFATKRRLMSKRTYTRRQQRNKKNNLRNSVVQFYTPSKKQRPKRKEKNV